MEKQMKESNQLNYLDILLPREEKYSKLHWNSSKTVQISKMSSEWSLRPNLLLTAAPLSEVNLWFQQTKQDQK